MNNISSVSKSYMCSNCGACNAICPKDSISFRFSSIGRMYASVDEETCVDCGLCTKVCPSLDKGGLRYLYDDCYVGELRKVYVGKCTDSNYYQNAQSGGACTAILAYMFDNKLIDAAVVTEMSYGVTPLVRPVIVTRKEDLYKTQKSCYTPVDVLSLLKETKSYKSVAIVGLPCHIQGVVSLQKVSKQFSNIKYLLGLVCDRTLCKSIQDVITSFSPVHGAECVINWRKKDFVYKNTWYSYKNAPVVLSYRGEDYLHIIPNSYRFALKEMFTPPRCRVCYDKINIFADIVFGDPWRMGDIDEKKGASVVAVRTEVGINLINGALEEGVLDLEEREIKQIVTGQLIEKRRKSIAVYSRALECMPRKINSYLYQQGDNALLDENEIILAREKLQTFIRRDSEPIDLIIKDGYKAIDDWLKDEKKNKNLIIRIIRKFKKILQR